MSDTKGLRDDVMTGRAARLCGLVFTLCAAWSGSVFAQANSQVIGDGAVVSEAVVASADEGAAGANELRVETNVCFAQYDQVELLCDLYLPGMPVDAPEGYRRPAVIVVHGGAWKHGDKWSIGVFARKLAEAGIVAVSINYRLAPEHKFPTQVDDVRSALVWLAESAEQYAIDPERIGMLGYSAGAHLSCMIGTLVDADWEQIAPTTLWTEQDPRWKKMPKIRSVVAGGTPADFSGWPKQNQALAYFLGGSREEVPEAYVAASPLKHASPGDARMLFIHGTQDFVVPIAGSRQLYELHQRLGVRSQFLALEGFGHMLTFLHPQMRQESVDFLRRHLGADVEAGAESEKADDVSQD